jgi:hypothetical protein
MDVLVQPYTMRPSCLRALDGDQSRGFGASAVTRVGIGWVGLRKFSFLVADRPGAYGAYSFDWIIPRDWISSSSALT